MLSDIDRLSALQEIDLRLRRARLQLAEMEKSLLAARVEAEKKRRAFNTCDRETTELNVKQRQLEEQVKDEEARIKDRKAQIQRVRNDKEHHAVRREIELRRETISGFEEELLEIMESLEGKGRDLAKARQALTVEDAKLAEAEKSLAERSGDLRAQLEATERERVTALEGIDERLIAAYQRIFDNRDGIAISHVEDGDCSACGVRVPPQLINEIYRRTELIPCPNCHRLFAPPAPKAATEATDAGPASDDASPDVADALLATGDDANTESEG